MHRRFFDALKVNASEKERPGQGTATRHYAGNERRQEHHDSPHDALMHDATRRQ